MGCRIKCIIVSCDEKDQLRQEKPVQEDEFDVTVDESLKSVQEDEFDATFNDFLEQCKVLTLQEEEIKEDKTTAINCSDEEEDTTSDS